MNSTQTIYKHGKLLISGEYTVLDGALALALPTKLGQRFEFSPIDAPKILWQALDLNGQVWFSHAFDLNQLEAKLSDETADALNRLFNLIRQLNPKAFVSGYNIKATLEFDRNWGLGSSSTLVSALANFFEIDPYALLAGSFGGSGYDLGCADANGPIVFQHTHEGPVVREVAFNPPFVEELFLVYLNQKMNSREAIRHYNARPKSPQLITQISAITEKLLVADQLESFEEAILTHERLMGQQLDMKPIGETLFKGMPGVFSSLGAWGGDFALFSRKQNIPSLKEKGYSTIFSLAELCILD